MKGRTDMCHWSGRWVEPRRLKTLEVERRGLFGSKRYKLTVLPEHEGELRAFHVFANRFGGLYLALLLVNVILLFAFPFYTEWLLVVVGLLTVVFPFTRNVTPAFGIRRAVLLTRTIGMVVVAVGFLLLLR